MDYFKHDINASEDDKICDLLAAAGYELLGYYWRFVEYLYSRSGKVAKNKIASVAWLLHMDKEKLEYLISEFNLFIDDGENIFSRRVVAEVEEFEANGKRMADIGRIGGKASAKARAKAQAEAQGQADALADGQADAQQKRKNKIKKENNIYIDSSLQDQAGSKAKEKKHAHGFFSNVLLTDTEMQKLSTEIPNYEDYIERLSHYIESNGKKYKSHYATILMWHRKDAEKQKPAQSEPMPQPQRRKSF